MSEIGSLYGLFEHISGRTLPRTPSGAIDMDQIHRDNAQRDQQRMLFGRVELESEHGLAVSDTVNSDQALAYRRAAGGLIGITVLIDYEGEFSDRGTPPEGYAFAIVDPENQAVATQYWETVNELITESQQPNPTQGEQNV